MTASNQKKSILIRPEASKDVNLGPMHPLVRKIFLSRGIQSTDELDRSLKQLPSPWLLGNMEAMIDQLVQAIQLQQRISVVADFDSDGATSCAAAVRGLTMLGCDQVNFIVPNRFDYGYGLTPEIVNLVAEQKPDIILTVDNGISSLSGVVAAKSLGIKVLITDHHLPGEVLPNADAIVNPNLSDDRFPSKNLSGVGVIFYVLMALRNKLRDLSWFSQQNKPEPNLAQLLDYVALGTVADVVPLDHVNRILVHQGLLRIRSGSCAPGIMQLIEVAGRNHRTINTSDLGFAVAPRLNAAGRMDDMSIGIQCLLTEDENLAKDIAHELDALNSDRREIETQMKREAMDLLAEMKAFDERHLPAGVCLYNANWHQGIIGILASRIKDRIHRPVVAFAPSGDGEIKGSARSIPGIHIRDVLSEIATNHPNLLEKFGGHAMAAGLTLKMHDYPPFSLAFDEAVREHLDAVDLEQKIYSDGELSDEEFNIKFAELLQTIGTWGQSFPEPIFHGKFEVIQVRIVGKQHLKWVLRQQNSQILVDAIAFFIDDPERWLGIRQVTAAYKLDINEFQNSRSIQLIIQYFERAN